MKQFKKRNVMLSKRPYKREVETIIMNVYSNNEMDFTIDLVGSANQRQFKYDTKTTHLSTFSLCDLWSVNCDSGFGINNVDAKELNYIPSTEIQLWVMVQITNIVRQQKHLI